MTAMSEIDEALRQLRAELQRFRDDDSPMVETAILNLLRAAVRPECLLSSRPPNPEAERPGNGVDCAKCGKELVGHGELRSGLCDGCRLGAERPAEKCPAEAANGGSEPADPDWEPAPELGELLCAIYDARWSEFVGGDECEDDATADKARQAGLIAVHDAGRASLAKRIGAYERFVEWLEDNYSLAQSLTVWRRVEGLRSELSAGGKDEPK